MDTFSTHLVLHLLHSRPLEILTISKEVDNFFSAFSTLITPLFLHFFSFSYSSFYSSLSVKPALSVLVVGANPAQSAPQHPINLYQNCKFSPRIQSIALNTTTKIHFSQLFHFSPAHPAIAEHPSCPAIGQLEADPGFSRVHDRAQENPPFHYQYNYLQCLLLPRVPPPS